MAITNDGSGKIFISIDMVKLNRKVESLEDVDMIETAILEHIDLPPSIALKDGSILRLESDMYANFSPIFTDI